MATKQDLTQAAANKEEATVVAPPLSPLQPLRQPPAQKPRAAVVEEIRLTLAPGPLKLIAACDLAGGIGVAGELPWTCPEDMRWFRATTLDQIIVVGAKTFASFGGRPLPRRTTIVISRLRRPADLPAAVHWARSLDNAVDIAAELRGDWPANSAPDIWLCGGAAIYAEALGAATTGRLFGHAGMPLGQILINVLSYVEGAAPSCDTWLDLAAVQTLNKQD